MKEKIKQNSEYIKRFNDIFNWEKVRTYLESTPQATILQIVKRLDEKEHPLLQGFIIKNDINEEDKYSIWLRWAKNRVIKMVKKWQTEKKAIIGTVSDLTLEQIKKLEIESATGHPYIVYLPTSDSWKLENK